MSNLPYQIIVAHASDAHTVYLSGSVDLAAAVALGPKLEEITQQCGKELRFDLHGVTFMDSEGLKALIKAYKQMQAKSGCIKVISSSKCVYRLLELTGLVDLLGAKPENTIYA